MLANSASFKSSYFLFCVLCIICFILFVYKYILVSFLQRVPNSRISRNLKSKNLLLVFFGLSCTHIYPVYPFPLLSALRKVPPFVSCAKLCCNSLLKVSAGCLWFIYLLFYFIYLFIFLFGIFFKRYRALLSAEIFDVTKRDIKMRVH